MVSFIDYKKDPSIFNRNCLVVEHIKLAGFCTSRIAKRASIPYEDIAQVGMLALITAVERFDPDKGTKFSTFAIPLIQGRILNFIRDYAHLVRIPRLDYEIIQKEKRVRRQLGSSASDFDVAQAIGVDIRRYKQARTTYNVCRYVQSDTLFLQNREIHDTLTSVSQTQPADFDIETIDDFDTKPLAVTLYFYMGYSLSKIARLFKISKQETVQLIRCQITKQQSGVDVKRANPATVSLAKKFLPLSAMDSPIARSVSNF